MTRNGDSSPPAGQRAAGRSVVDLTVLATSDLHAHLFPFNYYTDRRDDSVGLVRLAAVIDRLRSQASNCLLLDNGDLLQGAPLGDAAVNDLVPAGRTHPMIAALNALSYDAATLGNHDFDYGLPFLDATLTGAGYPVVLANVQRADGGIAWPKHTILERKVRDRNGAHHSLRIGVTGVAPPQTAKWHRLTIGSDLIWGDMVRAVTQQVQAARAAGADLVIVLAHSGLGTDPAGLGAENAARSIAKVPGVDAVIAGHTHRVAAVHPTTDPTGQDTPIVQPGALGSHLGHLTLTFEQDTDGTWHRSASTAATHPLPQGDSAALRPVLRRHSALRAQLRQDHRRTRAYAARVLGRCTVPLHSYFAMVAPSAALTLIAEAKQAAIAPLIAARSDLQDLPLAIAIAPFKAGGRAGPGAYTDIAPGALQLRHAADLYAYANTLAVLRVSKPDLIDWLERVASAFHRIDPNRTDGPPQPLLAPEFPSYNFDVFFGLSYRFDLTQPARTSPDGEQIFEGPGRVRDLALADGTPLPDGQDVLVATNSYRAGGGGHFPAAERSPTVLQTTEPVRDAVARYIADAKGPLTPKAPRVWSFAPLGGVPVQYATGPGSTAYPDDLDGMSAQDLGRDVHGYQSWRLVL